MIKRSPLLGYGFGVGGRIAIDRYYSHEGISVFNTFLEVALNVGIIGAFFFTVSYLGTIFVLVWNLFKSKTLMLYDNSSIKCMSLEALAIMIVLTFRAWTSHLGEHGLAMLIFLPLLMLAQLLIYRRTKGA